MTNCGERLSRTAVYLAIALAAAVWLWVAVTVQPLPRLLIAVLIPALPLAVPPPVFRIAVVVALVLMGGLILLTSLGVGRFLAPSAVALVIAAAWPRKKEG